MTRRRFAWGLGAAVLAVAIVAAVFWWRFGRAMPVTLVEVDQGEVVLAVVGPGTVQARVPVTLASRITATVTAMHADVGDAVRAGQLLAELDDRDAQARRLALQSQREAQRRNLDAAGASLARARVELELARSRGARDRGLAAQGFLSDAALDASRTAVAAAEATERAALAARDARAAELDASAQELRAAETAQTYARLVAPMDGIVVQRRAEPGATVVAGSALLELVDPASVWIAMRVDEAMLGRVALGQPARIRLRSGVEAGGRVARIARQSDAATREVDVHVAFDAVPSSFVVDAEAEVRLDTGRARGLVVPPAALLRDVDGRPGVLRVEDGRAHFVPARPGAADAGGQLVEPEVAGALRAGDRVVAPTTGVRDGMRVRDAG